MDEEKDLPALTTSLASEDTTKDTSSQHEIARKYSSGYVFFHSSVKRRNAFMC